MRAAWYSSDGVNFSLTAQTLASGPPVVLSTHPGNFQVRDGLLAWEDNNADQTVTLKVTTGGGTASVATGKIVLLQAGGGRVIYSKDGRVYDWNAATGQSTLRLDVAPATVSVSGGALVFIQGASIYRVPL